MVENYRPISLLEAPGKALEKIIEIEVTQHLDDYETLTVGNISLEEGETRTPPSP